MSSMDENEIEVAEILLQLPRLVAESQILRFLPFTWASKKRRTTPSTTRPRNTTTAFALASPTSSPNSSPKTPLSFSNLNVKIKPKTDHQIQNHHEIENPLGFEVKEERKRKNNIVLPDLNIPLSPPEEEEEDRFQVANRVSDNVTTTSNTAMAAEARRRRIQIVRSRKNRNPRSQSARGGEKVVTVVSVVPAHAFVSVMSMRESDPATN